MAAGASPSSHNAHILTAPTVEQKPGNLILALGVITLTVSIIVNKSGGLQGSPLWGAGGGGSKLFHQQRRNDV